MKAPVRIGIVGLGRLGQRHARNLAWHVPGATLAAACSPVAAEREWAAANLPELKLYDDYESMLKDASLDAVWLVTPTSLHADQIIAALRAGKHVFCEKPLSLDLAQCDRVIEESARVPHLQVMIGFVRRFDASYRDAFNKISQGAIGRPFMVRSQTVDKNDPDGFFVRFAPTSGGLFLDCSVHDIDLARWMLGNPRVTRVFASGTIAIHEGLAECGDIDNGVAICEFEGGRLAVSAGSSRFELACLPKDDFPQMAAGALPHPRGGGFQARGLGRVRDGFLDGRAPLGIERRSGGRGRSRALPRRARQRRRRLDPDPVVLLRPLRNQAVPRPRVACAVWVGLARSRDVRADRADRARCGGAARRDVGL